MQHLMGLHAYGVPDIPPVSNQTSSGRRWIRIPIPAARQHAYGGETLNLVQTPNKGSPTKEGERERERERKNSNGLNKRAPYPSIYRLRRGAHLPPLPMWD